MRQTLCRFLVSRRAFSFQELRASNRGTVAQLKSLAEFYGEQYSEDEPTRVIHTVMQFLAVFERTGKEVVAKQEAERRKSAMEKSKQEAAAAKTKHSQSLPSPRDRPAPADAKPAAIFGRVLDNESKSSAADNPKAPVGLEGDTASSELEAALPAAPPMTVASSSSLEKASDEDRSREAMSSPLRTPVTSFRERAPLPAPLEASSGAARDEREEPTPSWASAEKIESLIISTFEKGEKLLSDSHDRHVEDVKIDYSADPFGSGRSVELILQQELDTRGSEDDPDHIDFGSVKTLLEGKLKPLAGNSGKGPPTRSPPVSVGHSATGEEAESSTDDRGRDEAAGRQDFGSVKRMLEGKLKLTAGGPATRGDRKLQQRSSSDEEAPPSPPDCSHSSTADVAAEQRSDFGSVKDMLEAKLKFKNAAPSPSQTSLGKPEADSTRQLHAPRQTAEGQGGSHTPSQSLDQQPPPSTSATISSPVKLPPPRPKGLPPLTPGNNAAEAVVPKKLALTSDTSSNPSTAFHSPETSPLTSSARQGTSEGTVGLGRLMPPVTSADNDTFWTPNSPEPAEIPSSFARNRAALESSLGSVFAARSVV